MPGVKLTTRPSALGTGWRPALLLLMVMGWLATPAAAHPVPFSYLDLRLGEGPLEAILVAHVVDLAPDLNVPRAEALLDPALVESQREDILLLLRSRLRLAADGRPLTLELLGVEPLADRQALAMRLRVDAEGTPGALAIHCALVPRDPQHQTFLSVYEGGTLTHQEIFGQHQVATEYYTGGRQGVLAVWKKFLPAGVHHIFYGPDHILFLVGLMLLGGSLPRLLAIVTAFTVAHSITLTLAALEVVNLPPRLVEAAIALSIVYVGLDNLMVGQTGRDLRIWVAFFFGLMHGFGFAGVLREFGLPRQALAWSLLSFNLGVEIGQACIVAAVAWLLARLRRHHEAYGRRALEIGSVVVILAGTYWFIQRVFF